MDLPLLEPAIRLLDWPRGSTQVELLSPDGSLRRFCRLIRKDGFRAMAVAPPPNDAAGMREALAGWQIGRHLFALAVPVPEPLAFDPENGLMVCEDLGDLRLHDLVCQHGPDSPLVVDLYRQATTELARMQTLGRLGFDQAWCWDTPQYDRQLMLERESGYFLQALCRDLLQMDLDAQPLEAEFSALADQAAKADASFFLHRDFQSRNIMVKQGRARFIDFQGGRLGPLGYDLASLLFDPYASLPQTLQEDLLTWHMDALSALPAFDRRQFRHECHLLSVQRSLQMLGAFAFLSHRRGRPFFRQHILPALRTLQRLLAKFPEDEYPCLRALTARCLNQPILHSLQPSSEP